MITASQALVIALTATAQPNGQVSAGNALVEPREERYVVSVVPIAPASANPASINYGTLATIEKSSGRIVSLQKLTSARPGLPVPLQPPGAAPITIAAAYQNALAALQGHDNFDKQGPLSVILKPDHYEVTLPLANKPPGAIGADYAYQIWLDPKTGATLKILVAS